MSKKGRYIIRTMIVVLLLFLGWIFLAWWLAERLIIEKPLDKADAIMVLAGSSTYIERTQQAAELYKKGVSSKILLTDDGGLSGWSQKEQRNIPYPELAKRELISQGVPQDSIEMLPGQIDGTIYEAKLFSKVAEERNYKSVLLVTSAYHSRRAMWTFERVLEENDLKVKLGVKPAMTAQQTPPPFTWWLSPQGWEFVAGEYVKSLYYWTFI